MKMRTMVGKIVPGAVGILAGLGWWYLNRAARFDGNSPETLTEHWYMIALYLGALFGIAAILLLAIFWKKLGIETVLLTLLNVATAWGLVTLFFITSDPLIHYRFVALGLGGLQWAFLSGGVLWSAASFLIFGRAVDGSRPK